MEHTSKVILFSCLCTIKKEIDHILEKFPEYRDRIIDLYDGEDFKTLCEDYLVSTNALEECRLHVIQDKQIEDEFLHVYLELEKEIIRLLRNPRP